MAFLSIAGVAVVVFIATNLDNLLLLLMFFADQRFSTRQVVVGNCLAGLVLVFAGLACGLAAYTLPPSYLSWVGIVPLSLGCWLLFRLLLPKPPVQTKLPRPRHWNVFAVTTVCLAHGSDNVIVYGSLFTANSPPARLAIILVFLVMIALFTTIGHALVQHPTLGKQLRRIAPYTTPPVLIGFGLWFLFKSAFH